MKALGLCGQEPRVAGAGSLPWPQRSASPPSIRSRGGWSWPIPQGEWLFPGPRRTQDTREGSWVLHRGVTATSGHQVSLCVFESLVTE